MPCHPPHPVVTLFPPGFATYYESSLNEFKAILAKEHLLRHPMDMGGRCRTLRNIFVRARGRAVTVTLNSAKSHLSFLTGFACKLAKIAGFLVANGAGPNYDVGALMCH